MFKIDFLLNICRKFELSISHGSVAECLRYKVGNIIWVLWQISDAFQQCNKFNNRLRFDKVTNSLKVGTFLRHNVVTIVVVIYYFYFKVTSNSNILLIKVASTTLIAMRKGPDVTNPICWTCKNCSVLSYMASGINFYSYIAISLIRISDIAMGNKS